MRLLAYVFSVTNYAALKAHLYGTTKDTYTVYKLLSFLVLILSRMNQSNFKDRANLDPLLIIIKQCSFFCKLFQFAFKVTESQIADSDGVHTQLNLMLLTCINILSAQLHDLNKVNFSVH